MRQLRFVEVQKGERRREVRCPVCHGFSSLCKEEYCPYLAKLRAFRSAARLVDGDRVFGASPPSVFVGEYGYPKVMAGPLVPPLPHGDTALMDAPERWVDKGFDELLRYRLSLVRGKYPMDVGSAVDPSRVLAATQEVIMASRPTDVEAILGKRPVLSEVFNSRSPPNGPSAPLVSVKVAENPSVSLRVEKVVGDTDFRAAEAVPDLYLGGVRQSQITKLLSIGLLGVKKNRRLVPTEWSITAVDDILGKSLIDKVLDFQEVGGFSVFSHRALGNTVCVLLLPSPWMFEGLEGWITPDSRVYSDHELATGRRTYPDNLAGAYHAARLPVLEYLSGERRQAGAIVFMEVHPEWIPLGVWRFREIARKALRHQPTDAQDLDHALRLVASQMTIPIGRWVEASKLIPHFLHQTHIEDFFRSSR
ncbi:MAG TPA: hypothetical protein VMS77_05270 [Conexivisphaerales archaeon]|nr:hypothetical protein [Conexivisphaerales archaeon]